MTNSYGGRGDALNTSLPTSLNLAGTANLENCLMGGSAANANKATDGHGGAIYIDDASTANLENSSITNNEAARFGGGVYICTNGIMGVEGAVRVSGNTSTRTTNNDFTTGSEGEWDDDVCLQTISKQSKDVVSHNSGKIKVLGTITGSKIGITEEEITEGTQGEGVRSEEKVGDYNRQFTINYGDFYSTKDPVEGPATAFFFSNDAVFDVILLESTWGDNPSYQTTTGKKEATLGLGPINAWYVAGIVDDNNLTWGDDNNDGSAPDVPCRTLTGQNGVFARGYDPTNDRHYIFVVRSISIDEEAKVRDTDGKVIIRYPNTAFNFTTSTSIPDENGSVEVKLYRYSGKHKLKNEQIDEGGGTTAGPVAAGQTNGPGANLGPIVQMNDEYPTVLRNIVIDGLKNYDGKIHHALNPNTNGFSPTSAALAVEQKAVNAANNTSTITLKEGSEIRQNNNKDGNSNTGREKRPGGGVYNAGTLVCDSVQIHQNHTAQSGAGMYINSGTATLQDDSEIKDNAANENGGGVYINTDGTMQVNGTGDNGVKIQHNTAKTHGGGVYKLGTLKVQGNVTITDNKAGTDGSKGEEATEEATEP